MIFNTQNKIVSKKDTHNMRSQHWNELYFDCETDKKQSDEDISNHNMSDTDDSSTHQAVLPGRGSRIFSIRMFWFFRNNN